MTRRAPRRPAPPSVRLYPDVPWVAPEEVALPWWRRVLSAIELGIMVVVLGVLLTIGIGVTLILAFFALELLVG